MKKLLLIITLSFLIALPTFSANVIVDNADKVLIQQGLTAIDNDTNQLHIIGTNLMKKNPNIIFGYYYEALYLQRTGKYETALKYYSKAIEKMNNGGNTAFLLPEIYKGKGICYRSLEEYKIALANLQLAEQYLKEDDFIISTEKVVCYMALDMENEAYRELNKARKLAGNDTDYIKHVNELQKLLKYYFKG